MITVLAPSTAPCFMIAPSTTMQREPMKQLSSIMTGFAPTGSNTPPMPTPPAKCTFLPICAQLPTVAQVSTIVPSSTYAPILTKLGIIMQPFARKLPYRATAGGTHLI